MYYSLAMKARFLAYVTGLCLKLCLLSYCCRLCDVCQEKKILLGLIVLEIIKQGTDGLIQSQIRIFRGSLHSDFLSRVQTHISELNKCSSLQ